jgi:hypothetical protein
VPLRATADAILVNWLCIETFNAKGKRTYYNSFVSDLAISSATGPTCSSPSLRRPYDLLDQRHPVPPSDAQLT